MLQSVKLLLNLTNNIHNNLIEYHLNAVSQAILNFCNLSSLPNELEHIVVAKTVKIVTPVIATVEPDIITPPTPTGDIKSIQRGDTKIEYAIIPGSVSSSNSPTIDNSKDILDDIKPQLLRFRKMRIN
jgi:hypothetical protein